MVTFIKSWVWQGEGSRKYQINDTGTFTKELEAWLIENKIAVEQKGKKSDGE